MERIDKTIFLSYRRTNIPWALAIFKDLTQHGYDVFFDFDGLASGDFERVILENIKARAHFLVLLTPSALERCDDPADWLRREIEAALAHQRNIVPLLLDGFDFGAPTISGQLIGALAHLRRYHGLSIPPEFFDEAMERLRARYLNVPIATVLHPASPFAQQAATEQKGAAVAAPAIPLSAMQPPLTIGQSFKRSAINLQHAMAEVVPPFHALWHLKRAFLAVILIIIAGLLVHWGSGLIRFISPSTSQREEVKSSPADLKTQTTSADNSTGPGAAKYVVESQGSFLVVSGTGSTRYSIYDASGQKELTSNNTGDITEVFPGTYQVVLNGIQKTADVQANRKTIIESGSLGVSGTGSTRYSIYDASGQKELTSNNTGDITELFPGTYQVVLNGIQKTADVQANRKTIIESGSLGVPGTGSTRYSIYDASGQKELTSNNTGDITELFPGTYQVVLNGIRKTANVQANRKTIIE